MRGVCLTAALLATASAQRASVDGHPAYIDSVCASTPFCRNGACTIGMRPTYPEGRVVMFDSYRYQNVLGKRKPAYTTWQGDSNPSTPSGSHLEERGEWVAGSGGACRDFLSSCSLSSGWQDNWLMSPFISNNGASRVFTETQAFTRCNGRAGCRNELEFYVKQVPSGDVADRPQMGQLAEFDAYYTESARRSARQTNSFEVQAGMAGFYIVARDNGTCAVLDRLQAWAEVEDDNEPTDAPAATAAVPAPVVLRVRQLTCRGCGSDGQFAWQFVSKGGAVCDGGSVVPDSKSTEFTLSAACGFAADELSYVEVTADKARGGGNGWGLRSVAVVGDSGDVKLRATRRSRWVKDIARRPELKTLRFEVA